MATEMNVEAERADFEVWAELTYHQKHGANHEVIGWYYFEEVTQDKWEVWQASAARRAAQPADVGATELPPLPEPDGSSSVPIDESKFTFTEVDAWSKPLVLQYARDAIAHQSAPAQPATDFRALVQSIIEDGYLSETNMHRGRLALDGAAPAQPSTAPSALVQTLNKPSRIDAYVRQLAMSLWRTHYRETSPKFELLDDTHGVLTQIDNMITGLVLAAPTSDQQAAPSSMADAYVGAREDFAIWKKRALEAEESCRRLTAVLNEQNSPTFMDEPVLRTSDQQAGVVAWEYCPECGSYETHEPSEDSEGQFFCAVCNHEWHLHIDYTDVVRKHLGRRLAAPAAIEQAGAPSENKSANALDALNESGRNEAGAAVLDYHTEMAIRAALAQQAGAQPVGYVGRDQFDWLQRNTSDTASIQLWRARAPIDAVAVYLAAPTPATDQDALRERVREAWANYERMGEVCSFEGQPMIYASVLEELAELAATPVTDQAATKQANQQ